MYITYNVILQLRLFSRSPIYSQSSVNTFTKPGIRTLLRKKKKTLKSPYWQGKSEIKQDHERGAEDYRAHTTEPNNLEH